MIMMIQPAHTSMDPPRVLQIFHPHTPPTQHSNSSTILLFLFASSIPNALSSPNPSILQLDFVSLYLISLYPISPSP